MLVDRQWLATSKMPSGSREIASPREDFVALGVRPGGTGLGPKYWVLQREVGTGHVAEGEHEGIEWSCVDTKIVSTGDTLKVAMETAFGVDTSSAIGF